MTRGLAALLVIGSLGLLGATALHPVLPLVGAEDLRMIATHHSWYVVHQVLLYSTGLIIVGIWCRWFAADPAERAGLGAAFVVLGIGQALNGVNIAYMAGAGSLLARIATLGTDVSLLYDVTHAFAVMCGRLSGFLVSLSAVMIALTTGRNPAEPRWLVGLAWLAAVAGLLGNLLAPAGHPLMLTAVGVMAAWQIVTGGRTLARPDGGDPGA